MTVENRARSGRSTTELRCPACERAVTDGRCSHCGAAATAGRYTIEKQIAQTPRGRMYLAQDESGRKVALKELVFSAIPNLQQLESFRRETRLLAQLDHPGIPKFLDSFEEGTGVGTRLYLAQEFVEGESLADELARRRFEETEARLVAEQVLGILVWLQGRSPPVFHRDLKPANLIRRKDGSIALVDFGSARDTAVATLGATLDVGTWGYAPPEQLGGDVDATSDLYALGATLVHLLTRTPPRDALTGSGLARHTFSDAMRSFLERLLAPIPQNRFANATDALRALRGEASTPTTRPASDLRLRFAVAGALISAATIVGIASAALFAGGRESGESSAPAVAPPAVVSYGTEELADSLLRDRTRIANGMPFGKAVLAANPSDEDLLEYARSELETNRAMKDGGDLFEAQKAYREKNGEWLLFENADARTWNRLGIAPMDASRRYSAALVDGKLVVSISQNVDRDPFQDLLQFRENTAGRASFDAVQYALDSVNFDYVTMSVTPQPSSASFVHQFAATEARARQARELLEALSRAQQIHQLGQGKFLLYDELTPGIAARLGVTLPSPLHHRHSAALEDGKLVLRASGNVDSDPALDQWVLTGEGKPDHLGWDWQLVDED